MSGKHEWTRRRQADRSQRLRHATQLAFLALNAWIGLEFYRFVRQFEIGGSVPIERPPGVEGWLPIAGLMNTKYWLFTGYIPRFHPAAMFLFLAFVGMSWLARKSFCSWLCPIGTISERFWKFGERTFRRSFIPPPVLDIPLRGLKYLLLGFFAWAVGTMSAAGIDAFIGSSYGLIADVRMLDFFRFLTPPAAGVLGVIVIGSLFVRNAWCRYLCPYGALLGLAALASPLRIRRSKAACIDCGKCARVCPSLLRVDQLVQIRSAECTGCFECVAICPAEGALTMTAPGRRPIGPLVVAAATAGIFLASAGYAKWSGHWDSPIPLSVYRDLVPVARDVSHP